MSTSRVYGTSGSRRLTTNQTTVVLAGIQGPGGVDGQGFNWRGAWSGSTSYAVDDAVFYGSDSWISISAPNLGQVPADGSAFWSRMTDAADAGNVENGVEDKYDATYRFREWTELAFGAETYDSFLNIWIPAQFTVVLNTPGAPNPDTLDIWSDGTKFEVGSDDAVVTRTVQLPHLATTGLYVFYYGADGKLAYIQDPTDAQKKDLTEKYCLIGSVYYIGATETIPDIIWTDGTATFIGDHRHGRIMDSQTHQYLERTRGPSYEDGMAPTSLALDVNQCGMSEGNYWDTDLKHNLQAEDPYPFPILYRTGATGVWNVDLNSTNKYLFTQGANGRPEWNEWTGATWQQTQLATNEYVLAHIFATNGRFDWVSGSGRERKWYCIITGQNKYLSIAAARDGADTEIRTLAIDELPPTFHEFLPVATVIIKATTNNGQVKANTEGGFYIDWRQPPQGGIAALTEVHNNLTGRDATDVHPAASVTNTPAGTIAATDVQAAINELDGDVVAHVGDASGAHAASAISNTPAGTIAATDVQAALNELDGDKVATTRSINTTAPLTGGGTLASDRTLDISNITQATSLASGAKGAVPASGTTGDSGENLELLSHNNRNGGNWLPMLIADTAIVNRRNSDIHFNIESNKLTVRDYDFFLRNTLGYDLFWQREDFIHNSGSAGEDGWLNGADSGNFVFSFINGENNHPGICRLNQATETTAGLDMWLYPNAAYSIYNQNVDMLEAIVRILTDGSSVRNDIRVVLTTDYSTARANNTVGFEALKTDTNWHTLSVDNSGTVTRSDTGVAAAAGWYRLRFGYNGSWHFAINDVDKTAPSGSPSGANTQMCVQIRSKNTADGGVDVDLIQVWGGVTR